MNRHCVLCVCGTHVHYYMYLATCTRYKVKIIQKYFATPLVLYQVPARSRYGMSTYRRYLSSNTTVQVLYYCTRVHLCCSALCCELALKSKNCTFPQDLFQNEMKSKLHLIISFSIESNTEKF